MGCTTSRTVGSRPIRFDEAKVRARLQEALRSMSDTQAALAIGLPTISKGSLTLESLPQSLQDLHHGIPDSLASAPMRLLKIACILNSSAPTCFEDVSSEHYEEIPYSKVTDSIFQRTVCLSWRWHKSKPTSKQDGFSPMSEHQWEELRAILQEAVKQGMEYVWVDWSCVQQYTGDSMVEIQRSRLYYMRSGALAVVSDFASIPDSGPIKVILVKVLRMLQKAVDDDKAGDNSLAEQALVKILEVVLEKRIVASLEYFGRAWTLAG